MSVAHLLVEDDEAPPEPVHLPPLKYGKDDVVVDFEFNGDGKDSIVSGLKASAKEQGWVMTTASIPRRLGG